MAFRLEKSARNEKPDIPDDRRYAMTVSLRHVPVPEASLLRREYDLFPGFGRSFDTLFDDFFVPSFVSHVHGTFTPRVDMKETRKNFKIVSELPGLDEKDIHVSVHDGLLTISGEKREEKEETDGGYHHVERSFGCFSRSVSVPDTVETKKVESVFKNGILTVTLPKNGKAIKPPKRIPISTA